MKSIESNVKSEYIINKSKFITFLFKVNNLEEINIHLNNVKKEYKGATHYCYAYILDNVMRFNDDGEPNGTAGMPILNVLENNDLNFILCIVVRYFGGIKLGAGGLVRAYTNSVTEALNKINIVELVNGYKIKISFNYDLVKKIDNLIKDYEIINKEFKELVSYELLVDDLLLNELKNICNIDMVRKTYRVKLK